MALNIGIIGCGTIGKVHAASITKAGSCRVAKASKWLPSAECEPTEE